MPQCPKCASPVRMDHLRMLTGGDYVRDLTVEAYGNPQATVCGSCGYTELYAVDPGSLVHAVKQAEKRERGL